jgi:hypothetical protein
MRNIGSRASVDELFWSRRKIRAVSVLELYYSDLRIRKTNERACDWAGRFHPLAPTSGSIVLNLAGVSMSMKGRLGETLPFLVRTSGRRCSATAFEPFRKIASTPAPPP